VALASWLTHSAATKVFTVNQAKSGSFWSAFLSVDLYKKNQGRLARQIVAGAIAATICLLCWSMNQTLLADVGVSVRTAVTAVVLVAGLWAAFRVVNLPQFAEFLIEVQHEMAKVSWPNWPTLRRSTAVVWFVMGLLSVVLFCYDVVWHWLLKLIHVLQF
jgi:preprotein translocase subunit SecE